MSAGRHTLIAKRYAKALFGICAPVDFDSTEAQLKTLALVWNASQDLRQSMLNPRVTDSQRISVIDGVVASFGGWANEPTKKVVQILVSLRKAPVLPQLAESFAALVSEYRKSLTLEVTVATPMTDSAVSDLKARLSKALGGEVTLDVKSDAALLGGLTIRLGDKLLDRSVLGTLQRMAVELAQ